MFKRIYARGHEREAKKLVNTQRYREGSKKIRELISSALAK